MTQYVDVDRLAVELQRFADQRDWNRHHKPKNLAMAIAGEAGELCAEMQWLPYGVDVWNREAVILECADILIYLVRMATVVGFDLNDAVTAKLAINERKYPATNDD